MRACYFCAGGFDLRVGVGAELLVEGETDGLDGDVGVAVAFEEGAVGGGLVWCGGGGESVVGVPEDARGDVAAAADGDHEVGFEVIEDLLRGILAELVHLGSC